MAVPTLGWEIAQALGLGALATCLILGVLAIRPRAGAAEGFPVRRHEWLGWTALALAVLHVGLSLAVDGRVVEHLKPTAPYYELAGMLALAALVFLTAPAGAAARSRLWRSHRGFQAAHVGAACGLIVALAVHVRSTDRYVHGPSQALAYVLLSGAVLLALLRGRARRPDAPPASQGAGALVFGRYSRLVLLVVVGSLLALLPLLDARTALALREPLLARAARLPLDFPHERHRSVACIDCHHNYTDRTGPGSCISCHRSGRADLEVGPEARFHDFCLACHRDPPGPVGAHGPVTGCSTCHVPLRTASGP